MVKTLTQLCEEAVRVRGEMELTRNMIEHYNRIHPHQAPIDPEEYQPLHEISALTQFIEDCDRRLIQ